MNTMDTSRRDRRGSVLILVVAVLALLVLMGTAYIVSARTDRANATAMSASNNVDLARDAVMSQAQQVIGSAMFDSKGNVGGYDTTGTYTRTTGAGPVALAARNYDYPEKGTTFGETTANATMQDEPWLVSSLHVIQSPVPVAPYDFSELTPQLFNPTTGNYDLSYASIATSYTASTGMFNVVNDSTTAGTDSITLITDDQPNLKPDSYINLLPFSDASGVRYRFGVRILDTSRMANLNVGMVDDSQSIGDTSGTYFTSMRLAPTAGYPSGRAFFDPTNMRYFASPDSSFALQSGNVGSRATAATSPSAWQALMMKIELPTTAMSLFDLSDELELRSYGEFGTNYVPRPATAATSYQVWPNTLGSTLLGRPSTTGNPRRRNYTAYSFSREIRPYPDPGNRFTFDSATIATPPWPIAPAKISVNSMTKTGPSLTAMGQLAANLATAMANTGNTSPMLSGPNPSIPAFVGPTTAFTQDEICAYVANFLTQTWSGFVQDPTAGNAYFLPAGPSFVDATGMCIRTGTGTAAITTPKVDFSDAGANGIHASGSNIYLGYAAQPFINEIAVNAKTDGNTPPALTVVDFAVELFNPYQVDLSLRGYTLKIAGSAATPVALDGKWVPKNGFLVISVGTTFTAGLPTALTGQALPSGSSPTGTVLELCRPFYPRGQAGGTAVPAEVDAMDYSMLMNPLIWTTTPTSQSLARTNSSATAPWGCALTATTLTHTPSIGLLNPGGGNAGIILYDRFAGTPDDTTLVMQPAVGTTPTFASIRDFNRIMRIGHVIDATGQAIGANGLLESHLQNLSTAAPFSGMQLPTEAQIHFDFLASPSIYAKSPPTDVASPVAPPFEGDIRAVRFLDQITMLDRVSDASITIDTVAGSNDINKIRLPGQINVNTASGDVLRAIPNMTDQMVANILAYRTRTATSLANTYNAVPPNKDYSAAGYAPATFGVGIRSLGELLIPISDAAGSSFASIYQRDKAWGSIYNFCTVRSDTFAVYGYLEAVRPNPTFTSFTAASWYGTGAASVSDDPHAVGVPLIRLGRRRWVAIVDRSFCNYAASDPKYTIPRVVAIKNLPQ